MSVLRRPATARAGEGQLSLLAGILTETDRTVLELARCPGPKPPTLNPSWSPGCGPCKTNAAGCVRASSC